MAGNAAQTSREIPAKISFLRPVVAMAWATLGSSNALTDSQAAGRDVILDIIASYPELRGVFASSLIYCDLLRS
jgi:hypothetical protein